MKPGLVSSLLDSQTTKDHVGGKGWMLLRLLERGYQVPPFFVVPTDYDLSSTEAIEKELVNLRGESFSVRSSVDLEDGKNHSFAGLFDTHLSVSPSSVIEKIHEVKNSIESARVQAYLTSSGLTNSLKMAVVVQEMISADFSGVAFSRSPIGRSSDLVIETVMGVGEALVSGHAKPDSYRMDRFGEIVEEVRGQETSLPQDLLREIYTLTLKLEQDFEFPVDLEWCVKDGRLLVLQVRPITKDFSPLRYFVDTNLAESYPGVVSPLTASFVKAAYRISFLESAVLLGASGETLAQLERHYSRLVENVEGHLYYDLSNYYSVLSSLPGGEVNIKNWHRMIGGEIQNLDIKFEPVKKKKQDDLKALWRILRFILAQDHVLNRFVAGFDQKINFIQSNWKQSSQKEKLKILINAFEHPHGFGLTILNDLVVMLGLKAMTKFLTSKGISESQLFGFLHSQHGVESTKPLESLSQVLKATNAEVWSLWDEYVLKNPDLSSIEALKMLESKSQNAAVKLISAFLDRYGDRSFEELKLESLTFKQSAGQFGALVRFIQSGAEPRIKSRPEVTFPQKLNFFESLLWFLIRKITARSIQWREATRLRRTQFYNLIRELFLDLVHDLKRSHQEISHFRVLQFFNISIQDLKDWSEKGVDLEKLKQLLDAKLVERKNYPEFLCLAEGDLIGQPTRSNREGELTGQVACEGETQGKALVIFSPLDALKIENLEEYILVTPHTDPAWVYILSRCRGLVSEKGSILSHTAIIGRELNVPTLVGVKNACSILRTGDPIRLNTKDGIIERI